MLKKLLLSLICLISYNANALELCGEKAQGGIVKGQIEPSSKIIFNKKPVSITSKGEFLIAFGRDFDTKQSLSINDNQTNFTIEKNKWDIQNIKGLPQKTVTPSKADQKEIKKEYSAVNKGLSKSTKKAYWKKGFIMPVEKYRISCNFGGQRIMNGEKKNPHNGVDLAAPEGTSVKAPSDGVITLASGPYFYSGNIMIIDHGHNLFSIFVHLKDFKVKKGDVVKQGQIVATVGKTGRATGPHLHWGASLNGVRFNALSLLELNNRNLCFNL